MYVCRFRVVKRFWVINMSCISEMQTALQLWCNLFCSQEMDAGYLMHDPSTRCAEQTPEAELCMILGTRQEKSSALLDGCSHWFW